MIPKLYIFRIKHKLKYLRVKDIIGGGSKVNLISKCIII